MLTYYDVTERLFAFHGEALCMTVANTACHRRYSQICYWVSDGKIFSDRIEATVSKREGS
jgi:hypothetical protein